jgi:phosphopantetheinyl transferase
LDSIRQPVLPASDSRDDPPAYHQRLERMADSGAKQRSRMGLWLLRQLLAGYGYPGNAVDRIGFGPQGQPVIAGAPAFSISHSASLVACAIRDDGAIGLDVECRRMRNMARMARLLDAPEQAHVAREPLAFFDYWCAREATVKASGRVGLKRIRALTLDGDSARLDDRIWWLRPLSLSDGYAGCLASDRAIDDVQVSGLSDRLGENTGR